MKRHERLEDRAARLYAAARATLAASPTKETLWLVARALSTERGTDRGSARCWLEPTWGEARGWLPKAPTEWMLDEWDLADGLLNSAWQRDY